MFSKITTVCFQGIESLSIEVQIQISSGLPAFFIVGLPDKAVTESRERVRAVLHTIGLALPPKRVTINLSPADIQKEGSHYDLPILLGLLATLDVISTSEISEYVALGELSLDGRLLPVAGVLSAALHASSLKKGLICPQACGPEAAWGGQLEILAPYHLLDLVNHFKGTQVLPLPQAKLATDPPSVPDLKDVKGQAGAKRALEIAAAGGHNLLLIGPPGSGKSMLAARLPGILPLLEPQEALEVTMIHSLAGLGNGQLMRHRPFRTPHHSASMVSLIGGGSRIHPGEVSLSHNGVLFLDELPEFSKGTLEALRQPLETGKAVIARANAHLTYPARFQCIAAMNPCKCGYLADASQACRRAPLCGQDYQNKISGPILDRMDLKLEMSPLTIKELQIPPDPTWCTSIVAPRVSKARAFQKERLKNLNFLSGPYTNSHITDSQLTLVANLRPEANTLLNQALEKFKLSARGYHRTLRVSRTLADLEESTTITKLHVSEALSYRHRNEEMNLFFNRR